MYLIYSTVQLNVNLFFCLLCSREIIAYILSFEDSIFYLWCRTTVGPVQAVRLRWTKPHWAKQSKIFGTIVLKTISIWIDFARSAQKFITLDQKLRPLQTKCRIEFKKKNNTGNR